MASELDSAPREGRARVLERLKRFDYPVEVIPVANLPASLRRQIASGDDVFFSRLENEREGVVAVLSGRSEVVLLGPFPDYTRTAIEDSIGGWMQLTAEELQSASHLETTLTRLQKRFDFPVVLITRADLPKEPRERLERGRDIVFYSPGNDRWFAATPLKGGSNLVRFGPFPSFERNEPKAATTTLALVLLPAVLAICAFAQARCPAS